jgi:hypothetical protein
MNRCWRRLCLLALLLAPGVAAADPMPFDLAGPQLNVAITRAGATLPISETPNLAAGDQLSIRADLPPSQSVHYLLVAAFLRGATNPPPESWFYRAETWTREGRSGLKISVPTGAQQVLVFLAPETGGGLKAIMDAVRARPGAFVRAAQDLNQASLDRSRLDAFLAAIHRKDQLDQAHLQEVSPLLARSFAIKLNADCLKKTPSLQAACLTEGEGSLVLSDGQSASIVQALTTGQSADLINQLSITRQAGSGYYSPYIGAVMDIARILDSFHTAQYQYAPAIATASKDQLSLILNTPPSFRSPMSVLMTALPAVEPPQIPPLHPVDPKAAYCADKPGLVLPVEGAPLAFSTAYAHDMVLHLQGDDDKVLDIPVKADAEKGGFVADTPKIDISAFGEVLDASLRGVWGFDRFEGPHFRVEIAGPTRWSLAIDDEQSLVVGRDDVVHLASPKAVCAESVTLRLPSSDPEKVNFKVSGPDELTVTLALKDAQPGPAALLVKQFGLKAADETPLQTFTQAGRLDSFAYHVGDATALLKGARLDEVAGVTFLGATFKPAGLITTNGGDELSLAATDAEALARLKVGEGAAAKVLFKTGRTATLKGVVEPIRPRVSPLSKSVQPPVGGGSKAFLFPDPDQVEQGAKITFSIRAMTPAVFTRDTKVELCGPDGGVLTTLTLNHGLVLEDDKVALATLDTAQAFSASTFGLLRFRIVDGAAGPGDWQPLATLVRLPILRELKCGAGRGRHCQLFGSNLFLIKSISTDRAFNHPVELPEGFTGASIILPHPVGGRLFLKLHDSPGAINQIAMPTEE